jgi:hypothetical protein
MDLMADGIHIAEADLSRPARRKAAAEGKAMSDGSFPIRSRGELGKAISAAPGRGKGKKGLWTYIKRRAKALGATSMLPEDHTVSEHSVEGLAAGLLTMLSAAKPEKVEELLDAAGLAEFDAQELLTEAREGLERAMTLALLEDEEIAEEEGDDGLLEAGPGAHPGMGTGHLRSAIGHQLARRVASGAITRKQAFRVARQRKAWKSQYGSNWRRHVFGPSWRPGKVRALRIGIHQARTSGVARPRKVSMYRNFMQHRLGMTGGIGQGHKP